MVFEDVTGEGSGFEGGVERVAATNVLYGHRGHAKPFMLVRRPRLELADLERIARHVRAHPRRHEHHGRALLDQIQAAERQVIEVHVRNDHRCQRRHPLPDRAPARSSAAMPAPKCV